jgi:hypothetical protein
VTNWYEPYLRGKKKPALPEWNRKDRQPEPNRLVRLLCSDWTDYAAEGMFIPYKDGAPKKLRGKSRFCRKGQFGVEAWLPDLNTWKDAEWWQYSDSCEEHSEGEHDAE